MNRSTLSSLALALLLPSAIAAQYTVQAGDTLFHIAQQAGVSVAALQTLNHLGGAAVQVGQVLELPGLLPGTVAPAAPVAGVTVRVPAHLQMGDAFVLRLSGARAAEAQVQFPSEVGEDVRQPNEPLRPMQVGSDFVVLGRVVLGKHTPLSYRVTIGGETLTGTIPVSGQVAGLQRLNMPPSITDKLVDPARAAEEAAVERVYLLRTPRVWTQPFAPALSTPPRIATLFGQARTYSAGGPVEYHYGIDDLAPIGTPVYAINDGTVVMAGTYPVRGGLVVIDHGAGLLSMYFHQSKTLVRVGQTVKRGQQIGLVGSTGISNAPHLHLELRIRGEAVQPTEWLGKLLP